MKTWIVSTLAIVAGIVLGVGVTFWELGSEQDELSPHQSSGDGKITAATGPLFPDLLVAGGEEFDFGVMERDITGSHTFVLKNVGEVPLELSKGKTSCRCTVSELDKRVVPPGESARVTLQWKPTTFAPLFRESAQINTNLIDRKSISLSVVGRVTQTIRPIPEEIAYGNISTTENPTAQVSIYGYRNEKLEIFRHVLLQKETADHFEVKLQRLSPEQFQQQQDAKSGYLMSVTVKSGLPLGPIQQTIRLTTNVESLPVLDISIGGKVISDISLVGSQSLFNPDRNLLMIGAVKSTQGAIVTMHVLVKGPHRESIELSLGQVDPALLRVTIGQSSRVNDAVILFPLTIEVPKGSRPVNHLGSQQGKLGKIVIHTNPPQAKQLPIFVRFAVE